MKNILYGVIDMLLGTTKQTLSVEFVPYTMHYLNVRAVMSRSQWNMFCTATHRRNHGRCCECSSSKNLECHEQWSYELDTNPKPSGVQGTMRLVRLLSLCHKCHMGKHPSVAMRSGEWGAVKDHLKRVHNLNSLQLSWILHKAKVKVRAQSRFDYRLDFTVLNDDRAYNQARTAFGRNFTKHERQYCKPQKESE